MEEKKEKNEIGERSFLMDINIMEAPMFTFKQARAIKKMKDWENDENVSHLAKKIMARYTEASKENQMEYMRWVDSKGLEREFCVISMQNLPTGFDMDVFFALVSLLIKQEAPIKFNEEKQVYELQNDTLYCKLSDIREFLGLSKGGRNNEKIKNSIDRLKNAQYYSLGSGVLYNGKTQSYTTNERSESLVLAFDFQSIGENKFDDNIKSSVMVQLNKMIINNIKYSFIKFLNNSKFFALESGLPRRIYTYIEGNKYNKNGTKPYLKVSYDVLKRKIPLDIKYNSRLKKRIEKPLDSLINLGVINGYFYGDEIKINGIKEECIYIYFKGTQAQLIKSLTKEPVKITKEDEEQEEIQEDSGLVFPENIQQELESIGISTEMIPQLLKKYSKYKLAEHLLWLQEKNKNKKANSLAGLFMFSLKTENIVKKEFPHITKFIEEYRNKTENKNMDVSDIENIFRKYNEDKLEEFKKEDEAGYEMAVEMTLDLMEDSYKDKIKRMSANLINYSGEELDKKVAEIDRWELFGTEKEKSEVFKEVLIEQIRLYKLFDGFFSFNDFKQKYANGLIKTS